MNPTLDAKLVAEGKVLLEPGRLYETSNGACVKCLRHEPGKKPCLAPMPFPAWLARSLLEDGKVKR